MTLGHPSSAEPQGRSRRRVDSRLPLRWAVIIGFSGAGGLFVGHAEGAPAGLTTFVMAVGLLYQILRDR